MVDKELVFQAQDKSLVVISIGVANTLISYRQLSDSSSESAGVLIGERRDTFTSFLKRSLSIVHGTLGAGSWWIV